jgi:hypothetical protein
MGKRLTIPPHLSVEELARRYREDGPDGLGDRRHGNPGGRDRALLTPAQREQLRAALGGPAPDGGLWGAKLRRG